MAKTSVQEPMSRNKSKINSNTDCHIQCKDPIQLIIDNIHIQQLPVILSKSSSISFSYHQDKYNFFN